MRGKIRFAFLLLLILTIAGCSNEQNDIVSYEDRVLQSISDLEEMLTAPDNGWITNYAANVGDGSYLVWLNFQTNGEVYVRSDLAADDGEYLTDTLLYRIDAAQGLELIFETYGIFHFLFEQNATTFGGEFEFLFRENNNGQLIFRSLSDVRGSDEDQNGNPQDPFAQVTHMTLTRAGNDISGLFNTEIPANLARYDITIARLESLFFGRDKLIGQQLLFDNGISLFWEITLNERRVIANAVGQGATIDDIGNQAIANFNGSRSATYRFEGDQMILNPALTFNVNATNYTLDVLTFDELTMDGARICSDTGTMTPVYLGSTNQLGNFSLLSTYNNSDGRFFTKDELYSVNIPFIFDDSIRSVADDGVISEFFPDADGFFMTFGLDSVGIPAYSVGLFLGEDSLIYRHFEAVDLIGNQLNINFDGNYTVVPSTDPDSTVLKNNFEIVTNEIFSGNTVYISRVEDESLNFELFSLFNPCNRYEIFLVK